MLYITPKRAIITVAEEGVLLAARPLPRQSFPGLGGKNLPGESAHDETFKIGKTKKYMTFGGYKSGVVEVKDAPRRSS